MARKASLKTLLNRRIKDSDFPIQIRRRAWANWFSALMLPIFLAIPCGLIWLLANAVVPLGWGPVFMLLLAALMLIGFGIALDGIALSASADREGITVKGLIETRHFSWDEITHFGTWRIRSFADGFLIAFGFQAVIHVDGSANPKRMLRNLFFAGHFLPPFMELDGKDIIKLLAKVKRHVEAAQTVQEP